MNDNKLIQKQLLKNMFMTFIVFTIVFSTFGVFLYTQVESSMYQSSDEELLNGNNRRGIIERLSDDNEKELPEPRQTMTGIEDKKPQKHNETMINPRLIYIIRNTSGEIIRISPDNNSYSNLEFNKQYLNNIYMIKLNEQYSYRCINYQIKEGDQTYYAQILINVDAEESIMQNFKATLVISLILCVGIALAASYILSTIALKPIIESWKKQTEFVQNASHELRTPLTIIQAKQELLLENPESKIIDKTEDITITLSETRRLSKLVKELMELARSDSNKTKIEKRRTNIDELIKHVTEPFKEMANAQKKNFQLDLNYSKEINIDSNKIHELLVIILDNSIKYTEKGDTIKVKTEEKDGKLSLSIADTGMGVKDESIKYIFDRFYREDKARSRETGGSGLGLAIAKSIVTEHGGTIKAMHNKPKGTIIEIKLKN